MASAQGAYVLLTSRRVKEAMGGSARRSLGADPTGVDAAHREPAGDASPRAPGLEEPLEETEVQEISLGEWRCLQEHS